MSRVCPVCKQESPDEARYCFNPACLTPLDPVADTAPPPVAAPPPEPHRAAGWVWAVAGVVALAAAGVGALFAVGAFNGDSAKATPPTPTVVTTVPASTPPPSPTVPPATVPPRGTPIDPALITSAEASSTLPDQDGLTYGIANTLDGQVTTAWNSNGSTPGSTVQPVGQKLTYKLSAPQHIVGVRIINGFNPNDADHKFTDNYRVHTLALRGGGKERQVDLADSVAPQFVEVDFPNADALELEVLSVYPTTKWNDVGITEVQIFVTGS